MTDMNSLLTRANSFLIERDWWQFHNPKNDAYDILVEAGELAEHIIHPNNSSQIALIQEASDVFFGLLLFIIVINNHDQIATVPFLKNMFALPEHEPLYYEQIRAVVLQDKKKYGVADLTNTTQIITSLVFQASRLSDFFVWPSETESVKIAHEKKESLAGLIRALLAHLVVLEHTVPFDLPEQYEKKMQLNAQKYPVSSASAHAYRAIKDRYRSHQ
jgi:NTP pyrophosphatase (non-canonical NTP hydrolase)